MATTSIMASGSHENKSIPDRIRQKEREVFMRKKIDVVTVTLNPAIDQTITIANFRPGVVNRVTEEHSHPGGKGVNVGAVLADYGHTVAVTGCLGRDNSAPFEAFFAKKKIKNCFVEVPGLTRTSVKIVDSDRMQTTDINFPGQRISASDIKSVYAALEELDAKWYVVGGSVPPGVEKTIYRDMIELLRERGANVALDASDEALRFGIEAKPFLIKPNLYELETLTGKKLRTEKAVIEAARSLLKKGIQQVVVSLGAKGACFVSVEETVVAVPPEVEVGSTVGAGDAMVAGLVAGRLANLPLMESARLATSFSLHALSLLGGATKSPATVLSFMSRVAVH
jgi:1-phosphofructokinase